MVVKSLSVKRYELKYPINFLQYMNISNTLKKVLLEDKHNGTTGYLVRSVYFDTYSDTDFYEKLNGIEYRKKIRLRTYSPDLPTVKLELKRKIGDNQEKKSLIISQEDAKELINLNYDVLNKYESETASMFYNIMKFNGLRPVVQVEYRRKAFIHPMNNIRVTLDNDIKSSETHFNMFSYSPILAPVEDYYFALLEIKYNNFLFKWITDLIGVYDLARQSYSKYMVSRGLFERYMA
ncbi:polyphosphate polymerase domain-containing protein [Tepidimicrobium xylanilyticum]|uniref:VTC domain-containing protein n=1 Tax=Tepidimicrobium xylanilyticum TaxID=1123352 RepID=A0A1H2WTJ1_9FIRM|nr:polyphosphate polymerase domain-containing protein [Tepidimicrobium xylanilyticum]SDW83279.1 VTC domain-containing protein [Tepidimicrobium xylanilyticum]